MACEGCTSELCVIRGKALSKAMLTTCQRGNGAAVDAMLQKVQQARATVATNQPERHPRKAVATASQKPCQSCNSKRKSKIARTVDRIVSLKNAAVDFIQDGMHVATAEQQAKRSAICAECPLNKDGWCDDTKGGCGCNLSLKVMPRSSSCPLGRWSAYRDEYRPLVNPNRSLMFHFYPLKGKEWNWHWHIEQIRKHQDKFNGKIVIGVGVDKNTATIEEVQALFDGIRVDHWLRADNNKMAETLTHVEMLSLLQTNDPNAIIFRAHTKGVTKTSDAVEQKWKEIMWTANMDLHAIEDALASHGVACCLRSQTPLVKKKPDGWFPAGSFYWMRAKEVFERDWTAKENNRWWVEFVPSHLFALVESACIFHDLVPSSVLNHQYFAEHVDAEWTAWKAARGIE